MRLVVDANILVAELIRQRGRELIIHPELELYMAEKAWDEACHELNKRVATMVQKGIFSQDSGQILSLYEREYPFLACREGMIARLRTIGLLR